jgi:hypothetical protein
MATTVLVIAVIVVALIGRSAIVGYHRQARINALRDDLAQFFAAIDVVQTRTPLPAYGTETNNLERQQRTRADALMIYRRILLRLNVNERLHQRLEKALEGLLVRNKGANQDDVTAALSLARTVLNEEWDVTNYGALAEPIAALKNRWARTFGFAKAIGVRDTSALIIKDRL